MQENLRMTPSVQKNICEYFNGDYQDSVYQYRSGSNLVEMYTTRFGTPNIVAGPSRWTLCDDTINYMYEMGNINEFFTVMLSLRNINKELRETNQAIVAEKRKEAIDRINQMLLEDDLELLSLNNRLILHHIDDDSDLIGSGGFANVYRVPGTNTVVKKLRDEFKDNDGIVSRFKQEFHLIHDKLQGIDGIIEGYEYNVDEISYTMEYCSTDLKNYIADMNLNETQRIDLVLEILGIMDQVHNRGVLHRDLSPKNIFIKDGHPIIADFGLGKAIDGDGRTYVTIDTSMNGTLEYCDPRQFQGLGFADKQSDIYSLGRIVNYVMTRDSDNFKHTLSIVSTIATEASLDARYHTIKEMIDKINRLTKTKADNEYAMKCERFLSVGHYDKTMDEFLLSFEEDNLINRLNNIKFRNVYSKIVANVSYNAIMIDRFESLHQIFLHPIGHTFASFDGVAYFCIDTLKNYRNITPALKTILGECIYDIAEGIDRWSVQEYFDKYYRDLEPDYIQEAISASLQRKK